MASSDEYYTPPEVLADARALMGPIHFDPCSCELANQNVQAEVYADEATDCLSLGPWLDTLSPHLEHPPQDGLTVWMNPPYSREAGTAGPFVERLVEEWRSGQVSQAMVLLNNVAGNQWFQPLWEFPVLFFSPRLKFYKPDGQGGIVEDPNPRYDNLLVYLPPGPRQPAPRHRPVLKFQQELAHWGHVTNIWRWR